MATLGFSVGPGFVGVGLRFERLRGQSCRV